MYLLGYYLVNATVYQCTRRIAIFEESEWIDKVVDSYRVTLYGYPLTYPSVISNRWYF